MRVRMQFLRFHSPARLLIPGLKLPWYSPSTVNCHSSLMELAVRVNSKEVDINEKH